MSFHKHIKDDFGKIALVSVRNLEKTCKKIARYRNHLRFNLHCKHHNIRPVSLRLSSTVKGEKANQILKRAEKQLTNVRISQTVRKLKFLNSEKDRLDSELSGQLPVSITSEVWSRVKRSQIKEHELTKERQQYKFTRLVQKNAERNASIPSECIQKWVKNCSDRLLNDSELSVLAKGLNFAATNPKIPVVDIITQTEVACRHMPEKDANSLRSQVSIILNRPRKTEPNLPKEEREALKSLKQDETILILPADKGRLVVVVNKEDYKQKCQALLDDKNTYLNLGRRDPTSKYKRELVSVLQQIEEEGGINRILYRQLYPTTETPPKFYGLPKVHKTGTPLRPIVSSIGSITYTCAKFLAKILSPLVGRSQHHVTNSQHFVELIKNERVEDDEELRSFDVTALFTSVPVDKALEIIYARLQEDSTLSQRSTMSPTHVVQLLKVCLKCTYFLYDGVFYQQIHGAAMGSPVSPIVCNLYMEHLEHLAITTAPHPPLWWYRYVDDTHSKLKRAYSQEFTDHLNNLDPDIKFTTEGEQDRSLPFLDTLTVIQDDGSIRVKIYRKPTHTDQYLNFSSNHPLDHKLGVIRTLFHRADSIITDPQDKNHEREHVKQALTKCGYPQWAINKATSQKPPQHSDRNNHNPGTATLNRGFVILPYIQGISEALRRIFSSHGVKTCFRPTDTLRSLLGSPKDKTPKGDKCGAIYYIPCQGITNRGPCQETYIGETERALKTRFLEHRRPSSVSSSEVSQHLHLESPGHMVSLDKVEILDADPDYVTRGIREAIYIRALQPSLNRDGGRYKLPATFDPVLESRVRRPRDQGIGSQ